jgi:hypothetical protein
MRALAPLTPSSDQTASVAERPGSGCHQPADPIQATTHGGGSCDQRPTLPAMLRA